MRGIFKMVQYIVPVWAYAYSSDYQVAEKAYVTVPLSGQSVYVQVALSFLTSVTMHGAGALIKSYTPPFGPDIEFNDFKYNGMYIRECWGVTFELSAVASEAYVLELTRYVVLNPVRSGWCRAPEEYQWSSYAATGGLEPAPSFLQVADVLDWFGAGVLAQSRYRSFVHDGIGLVPPEGAAGGKYGV